MSTVMDKPKGDTRSRRKKRVALVTAALLTVSGGAAIAYWTVGGAGTGTAATGTSADIKIVQTSDIKDLRPGGKAQTLSGTFDNGNAGPVYVKVVTASIASVKGAEGGEIQCDKTDYTLEKPDMEVDAQVETGNVTKWGGATIQFNNDPRKNQDACKGATVNLAYTVG